MNAAHLRPVIAHASGALPYRVLVLDAAGLVAVGDDAALVAALADGLAQATGNGVDVELVAGGDVERLAADRDLARIDAVVVTVGSQLPDGRPTTLRAPIDALAGRMTVGSALVLATPSARVGAALREVADALTPVVVLEDSHRSDRLARRSEALVDATAAALIEPLVRFVADDPFDELARVETVLPHTRSRDAWAPVFQDLVEAARSRYETPSAAMSIIDDDTTHYFARSGNTAVSLPRGKTVCNRVLRIYGGLVLGDARLDHRFVGLPEVKSGDVRFYAGYRITGPDGAPFGALCVFDSSPRDVADDDLTPLRDLALEAQRRLWTVLEPA